jgi:hypothetical protein
MDEQTPSVSRYDRDRSVAPAQVETYRGMRRRFRRGQAPTAQEPSVHDLNRVWEQVR